MSIPLDRLYYYIESIAQEVRDDDIIIYHFWPHGSKNIENLIELHSNSLPSKIENSPRIICHDQEPLFFDLYNNLPGNVLPRRFNSDQPKQNRWNKTIILHSEKNSKEVDRYSENQFIPVYYWSHAVISRDWFRYAEHILQHKKSEKRFLIYNRAWSGTREYRIGFADKLILEELVHHCFMRVSPVDSSINKHYTEHEFERPQYRPVNRVERYFPIGTASSEYSADFDIEDYESTDIEIVLETLFDDQRIHLTEKTLRPIALEQPFILAGPPGSLQYLRDYGFKTFSDCWDESYDTATDSSERMNKILNLMKHLASLESTEYNNVMLKARNIAYYNKQHFFSAEFQQSIIVELIQNLETAYNQLTPKS